MQRMVFVDGALTVWDFDYAVSVVRQEIRLALFDCAQMRHNASYTCGTQLTRCPAFS